MVEKDKKGFVHLDGVAIKIFNDDNTKVIVLKFNDYLYIIDDTESKQEVVVWHDNECEVCSDNPIKQM